MIIIKFSSILLFYLSITIATQGQDATLQKNKGTISSVRDKLNAVTNANAHTLTDTLKNLLTLEKDTSKVLTFDSLQQKLRLDSINTVNPNKQKITSLTDSLTAISNYKPDLASGKVSEIQNSIDSLTVKIRSQQDSITNLLEESQQRIQEKITGAPAEVTDRTNKINDKFTTDVNLPNGLPPVKLNAPLDNLNVPSSAISELNTNVIQEADIGIPNADIPSVEDPNVPIPDTEGIDLPDELHPNALKEKVNLDIPESDKIQEAKEKVTAVDSKLAVAEKYEGEVTKLKEGDYSSAKKAAEQAEQKAAELSGVDKLSGETEKLTQQQEEYKAMLQKYRDKKLQQEEVLRKMKNVANDKLNKFTPAVTEVQENMAKAKKLNPAVKSAKEMAKKRTNPMRGKPFHERLIPGISLQAYNLQVYSIDLGPQLAFKLSGRFTIGAGGIYRLGISEDFDRIARSLRIYGYRAFTDINLVKGIYVHGELEKVSVESFVDEKANIDQTEQRITNFNFGLGKRFAISKKLNGFILVLYRAELEGHMPSVTKINLRLGFDLNMKKRKKIGG